MVAPVGDRYVQRNQNQTYITLTNSRSYLHNPALRKSDMVIKIGTVSYNTRTGKINLDRRTIRGQGRGKHMAYIAVGVVATAAVAAGVEYMSRNT
jgi:hypothetical protein